MSIGEHLRAAVQPFIAIIFAVTACVALFIDKLNADQWLSLAVAVVSFYFAAKTSENASQRAQRGRATDVQVTNANVEQLNVPGDQLPSSTRTKGTRRR